MNPTILIADDEPSIRRLIERTLSEAPYRLLSVGDGREALEHARRRELDLIVLDNHMPGREGVEVLAELRSTGANPLVPVILVTGDRDPEDCVRGLERGADDYLCKPFLPAELAARVAGLLRRSQSRLGANPLTRLPGSPSIEEAVERRIREGRPFAFLYADIDRFKSFNDAYGYARGDRLILETASLLLDSLRADREEQGFVGHIGGDDFAVVCAPEAARRVALRATVLFDRTAPAHYAPEDRARGYVETRGREGTPRRFPLACLSIGGVTTERRRLAEYAKVAEIASEMKAYLKARPSDGASSFAFDRRSDYRA